MKARKILLLGASGLIGRFVTDELRIRGFDVIGIARCFSHLQRGSASDLEMPIMSMDADALSELIRSHDCEIVVNCLGVLQDGPGSDTRIVHRDFVARLLKAIQDSGRAVRFIHISIPGLSDEDRTAFSRTKRQAEKLIATSGVAYAILRPGFVIAPAAYGGSALLRAIAAFPVDLPAKEQAIPFQPVAIEDIVTTIAWLAGRDIGDDAANAVAWDLMQPQPITLGRVIEQFRRSIGTSDTRRITLPMVMIDLGAQLGDIVNWLGWMPPMRTTAIVELRRGGVGDPRAWMASTGIVPKTIEQSVGQRAATIQDKWFVRLFMVKALVIASLALFWILSGFIALFVSYREAVGILGSHGFPPSLLAPVTILTSLMDMTIGLLIAVRRTSAFGLIAGIAASLGYMTGAAILTPDLRIEPLGALVKTGPAIVLMLVALLILDNR